MTNLDFNFENAIDNIANNPTESIARLNREEIEKAHKNLRGSYFWGYIDEKGYKVRKLVEQLLNKKI